MVMTLTSHGMLRSNTPVQDYTEKFGLWVKREDLSCPPPGPKFSKARGVYAHIAKLKHKLIGVLDTRHSQAGHAVARACQVLGKKCVNYYPEFKHDPGHREPQAKAKALGASLHGLKAGMSAVLWYQARKLIEERGGYMMPNALKLVESVDETAKEVEDYWYDQVVIPVSSATIAAGVIRGYSLLNSDNDPLPTFILHMGYSRSHDEVLKYVREMSQVPDADVRLVDEKYQYKDTARPGDTPPWPCNEYYDLKALRWWTREGREQYGRETLFWNIG